MERNFSSEDSCPEDSWKDSWEDSWPGNLSLASLKYISRMQFLEKSLCVCLIGTNSENSRSGRFERPVEFSASKCRRFWQT